MARRDDEGAKEIRARKKRGIFPEPDTPGDNWNLQFGSGQHWI